MFALWHSHPCPLNGLRSKMPEVRRKIFVLPLASYLSHMLGVSKQIGNFLLTTLHLKLTILSYVLLLFGCAYFNTLYNAKSYYRQGKKLVIHDTLRVDSEFFDKTIEKSTVVLVKYPGSRWADDALFIMGASYYYKGDYSRSLEKLDFLAQNYPASHFYDDALYYRGLAYYKQDKLGGAVLALKEAMESKQFQKKSMIALCYVYNKDKNYVALTEAAKNLLARRLDLREKRDVLRLLGAAQFNQKSYAEALTTFNQLLAVTRINEDRRELKLQIAKIYLEMCEYGSCQDFLAGEDDAEFRTLLADLHVRMGNLDKAKELYHEVAQNGSPDFASQSYFKLAKLYEDGDSAELAIAYYDSSTGKSSMGEYGVIAKKRADILKRILNLTKETENVEHARFLLAETYYVDLNEPKKAITEYQMVYQNFPTSPWAPKALYAQFWITKNVFKNDSLANQLAQELLSKYPSTEYALSAKNILAQEPRQ